MKRISIFLITVALLSGMVGCGDGNGLDPYADYIKIYNWTDLDNIRNNLAVKYVLMNDLDSSTAGYEELASTTANGGKGWEPIGTEANPFTGTLDGQGYEIRDLVIDRSDEDYVGLLGHVGKGGFIRDIGVTQFTVIGYDYVGGLVGYNEGTVINSYSIGNVMGEIHVGGLVGYDSGNTVSNSYYNHDESLINGENMITTGALSAEDFEEWLANNKFLDVSERLSQEDGYYLIESVSDFKELLAFGQNATLKFRLTNDLDLGSEPNFYIPYLAGEFDGNGHIISNLSLNLSGVSVLGLFGYLVLGGNVTEVGVENVNITGEGYVGGLVGTSSGGTVSNSYSTGNVTGEEPYVGGLVGNNNGTVSNSYASASVSGEDAVGGLVGNNDGTVSNSYSTGSVTGKGGVGGLVGQNYQGTVSNSHSTGNVTGDVWHTGGLVGTNFGTVSNSYATGSVTSNDYVGGLVGTHWGGTVSNSYSTGNVTGDECVGGLVGQNSAPVSNSYSTSSVTGTSGVGGLVGQNYQGTLSNSYSTGTVTGEGYVGGLVGQNYQGTVSNSYSTGTVTGEWNVGGLVGGNFVGAVSNSYWDTETSGQSTSPGGTGKTTTEMQDIATFSGAAWDIIAVANPSIRNLAYIWNIVDDETYPFLNWQPVS